MGEEVGVVGAQRKDGQHQLSTLSGTSGNQPGITGKRLAAKYRSSRPVQAPHQRHDLRLLPHGPSDDHALDF
jgi:hypothetical protein